MRGERRRSPQEPIMNAKTLLSLVVAIALGLAATWVGRNIIGGDRALGGGGPEMVRVVVAKVRHIDTRT